MSSISMTRLNKEYENMIKEPSENIVASPVKDDMFCWHFTIRGTDDSEFEGGLYHGVIKLPTSYPQKPPSVMFLTPNGRFETNTDICLSMTKYHKEEWQAAWTSKSYDNNLIITIVQSMLEAIRAFMPVKEDHDAIGAINLPLETRKKYATLSNKYKCDICGPLIDLLPEKVKKAPTVKKEDNKEDEEQAHSIHSTNSSKNKKKIEQSQRIKAVIVEDSHEDDFDDENKFKKNNNHSGMNSINTDKDNNNSVVYKTRNENKEIVDFSAYFKKTQREKFEKDIIPKQSESQQSPERIISSIKRNNSDEEIFPSKNQQKQQEQQQNIPKIISYDNQFNKRTQILEDELEFQQLMNDIKAYNTKSNEEIHSLIDKDIIEKKKNLKETQSSKVLNDFQLTLLLQNNQELEKLLKKQINTLKIHSKTQYEMERNSRLRIMNIALAVSLIIIFGYFWGIKMMS